MANACSARLSSSAQAASHFTTSMPAIRAACSAGRGTLRHAYRFPDTDHREGRRVLSGTGSDRGLGHSDTTCAFVRYSPAGGTRLTGPGASAPHLPRHGLRRFWGISLAPGPWMLRSGGVTWHGCKASKGARAPEEQARSVAAGRGPAAAHAFSVQHHGAGGAAHRGSAGGWRAVRSSSPPPRGSSCLTARPRHRPSRIKLGWLHLHNTAA